jgi:3-phosphoshikimate 1-carboxyvinyltransferase
VENTVEVMRAFGAHVELATSGIRVQRGGYQLCSFGVELDASAAAYPLVAAAITGGTVLLPGFPPDSTQADLGILTVLSAMGCRVEWSESGVSLAGPADGLRGVEVDMGMMPDAVLAVAVAAAFASGPTRLTNIANLRLKESDRLIAVQTELEKLGVGAEAGPDWLIVRPGPLHGAEIETHDDHRMAMAFSVAGLVVPGVVIRDPGCVAKTWPNFFEDLEQLWSAGVRVTSRSMEDGIGLSGTIVAIDGPGGSGKTTVSRGVADRLTLPHLDSGASYRAAALAALRRGVDPNDVEAVTELIRNTDFGYRDGTMLLGGEDVNDAIRDTQVTSRASQLSAIPEVRELLVAWQRDGVKQPGGSAVIEGRDIGTVVFPEALVKIFLTARPEVRAARRANELSAGTDSLVGVARELERRDKRDSTREASPLRPAADAVQLDTSDLGIEEVIDRIVDLVVARRS